MNILDASLDQLMLVHWNKRCEEYNNINQPIPSYILREYIRVFYTILLSGKRAIRYIDDFRPAVHPDYIIYKRLH